jgi:quercetin dioxygenase-like cupin family protein
MEAFRNIAEVMQFASEKMKKNSLLETERFICELYCFEPGQAQSPHAHDGQDKVYYVVEGKGLFRVGAVEKELGPGEMALAASGQNHGVSNRSGDRLVVLVFVTPRPSHSH